MYGFLTNFYIFLLFIFLLVVEYFMFNILNISYLIPWLITAGLYSTFIITQAMSRASEETEKGKIKVVIDEIYYSINGIPILNKNQKLIIKWDIIFKKLVEANEFKLYDKIVKTKTNIIDEYINRYPSLLLDNTDLSESSFKTNLDSVVKGKGKKKSEKEKELLDSESYKYNLFIKEFYSDRAVFSNFDGSIYMDVLLSNEYYPENYESLGISPDSRYDGFSVSILFNNTRYNIVPRYVVSEKVIDKEKWFFRHIPQLLEGAKIILKDDDHYIIQINDKNISEYCTDLSLIVSNTVLDFEYYSLQDKFLLFKSKKGSPENITVFCEFDTAYNSFEIIIKKYERKNGNKIEVVELEKVIAMGTSYQPLIILLQRMPAIVHNINQVMNDKDISDIVIR